MDTSIARGRKACCGRLDFRGAVLVVLCADLSFLKSSVPDEGDPLPVLIKSIPP